MLQLKVVTKIFHDNVALKQHNLIQLVSRGLYLVLSNYPICFYSAAVWRICWLLQVMVWESTYSTGHLQGISQLNNSRVMFIFLDFSEYHLIFGRLLDSLRLAQPALSLDHG